MMTLIEAEKILNVDYTKNKIDRVSESTNYFIFSVVPNNIKTNVERSITASIAVDKRTGQKLTFNPMRFPKDELKSVKRIR